MTGVKSSPAVDDESYRESEEGTPCDRTKFQSIIGGLLFIAYMTQPEISVHVNLLGRRASSPSLHHLQAAHQILKYLESMPQDDIRLKKPRDLKIEIYADASYREEQSRSQSGGMITGRTAHRVEHKKTRHHSPLLN